MAAGLLEVSILPEGQAEAVADPGLVLLSEELLGDGQTLLQVVDGLTDVSGQVLQPTCNKINRIICLLNYRENT